AACTAGDLRHALLSRDKRLAYATALAAAADDARTWGAVAGRHAENGAEGDGDDGYGLEPRREPALR
ncbi:MAG: hypothetical protein M3O34_20680, partial [Chloroflexota bacterium]|nr:hypothetical protein [Chloroflexota bacterium]